MGRTLHADRNKINYQVRRYKEKRYNFAWVNWENKIDGVSRVGLRSRREAQTREVVRGYEASWDAK
jgi:hypothetical protein